MKADEMLKECGYPLNEKCKPFEDIILYGSLLTGNILFDTTYKNVVCSVSISPKLLLAIQEKMKELGWFE